MSTISQFEADQSDQLARRFARLAAAYFDQPADARTSAAQIPLENLFRLLQMFRYDAFSDEPRCGILELKGFGEQSVFTVNEKHWHDKIEAALLSALNDAFGQAAPRDQVVNEVQSALRWLATNGDAPPTEVLGRAKHFLERFRIALG